MFFQVYVARARKHVKINVWSKFGGQKNTYASNKLHFNKLCIVLGGSGRLCEALATFWEPLRLSERLWESLGSSGKPWKPLGSSRMLSVAQGALGGSERIWETLRISGEASRGIQHVRLRP